jgi:hypothetical protein
MKTTAKLAILKKLAQAATNQMATDEVNKNKSVAGAPPSFTASSAYPSLVIGFNTKNVPWINGLSNVLNDALYYTSNGQVNLQWMKTNNFGAGISQIPSQDLKNIMAFCKLMYTYVYTNLGQEFKQALTSEQIAEKINYIKSQPSLNNLPSSNTSGQLTTKLGGNLKTIIQNYLLQIK